MLMKNKECGYALKVADQVHIHLPSNAFTNEASNFWFGAVVGASLLLVVLASMANK
jgi:hypothetical protein